MKYCRNTVTQCILITFFVLSITAGSFAETVLVEVEGFEDLGGWELDQQFMDQMGSPYLLAHGLGKSVDDAVTTVTFPAMGTYKMWVRTKNWVPGPWDAPGRFKVLINNKPVSTTFGTNIDWGWQDGGTVEIKKRKVKLALHDLTGFDARCDAIYFDTNLAAIPPNDLSAQRSWRNQIRGLPTTPPDGGSFDVIIVGGGIAGCAAALAAEETGMNVALIQDRPVLGGNASSEVRVHTLGIYGKGQRILEKIDTEHYPNGDPAAIADQKKRNKTMKSADGITFFMPYRAYDVQTKGSRIVSVDMSSIRTGAALRLQSNIFIDCTGDGWIGFWAGAEYKYGRESKNEYGEDWPEHGELWSPEKPDKRVMGSSLLWYSKKKLFASSFPDVPWAMDVAGDHAALNGEWFWEYSDNDKHMIDDGEEIRDHMLRAIYGSFANAKKEAKNDKYKLDWVCFINGKRESRRLVGDYIYTFNDEKNGTHFDDAVVEEIREIDVHFQNKETSSPYDFLSTALYYNAPRYYVPFRCLYSKNIENLMMAGRCFSCSHVGLGGPRVMRTCGQMGIAVGYAASLCKEYNTNPRGVYTDHIDKLKGLISGSKPKSHKSNTYIDAPKITSVSTTETVLVEAESFDKIGGWVIDQQFMDQMGSAYLLAHGMGEPVTDACTTVSFPKTGQYHVWVRTLDWVAPWEVKGAPGKFKLIVDGKPLKTVFGTTGAKWHWQDGGKVQIKNKQVKIAIRDLTGFEGRCDTILFSTNKNLVPPNEGQKMAQFRRKLLGISDKTVNADKYDLVVVGGGIAGMCTSISAARLGLNVALIQDRPVLGGNNSSEVRVWLNGEIKFEPFPQIGDIVAELEPKKRAHYGPDNVAELYEDSKRESLVRAEENIDLFLMHRANDIEIRENRIKAVIAQDIKTGKRLHFEGKWFVDCTGDGCIGYLAGADYDMTIKEGHMGRSNLWNVDDTGEPSPFPRCEWALDVKGKAFPGIRDYRGTYDEKGLGALGGWYWESGFFYDPIEKSEHIRDLNLRAMYGVWDTLKNSEKLYPNYKIMWVAYISGKRESRRLLGDIILTKNDLLDGKKYEDGCVPTSWDIDLHLPTPRYVNDFGLDAVISTDYHTAYNRPYWVPYRCLYSRNIDNLFMAGRDISVTHEALGSVRVMRTAGMMGEVVGMAASLCEKYNTDPRGVYKNHLNELKDLMKQGVGKKPIRKQ